MYNNYVCCSKLSLYNNKLFYIYAGVIARTNAYYGQGTGPVQLNNVACAGTEQNLIDCTHITNHNCAHSKDAGVDCPGKQTLFSSLTVL